MAKSIAEPDDLDASIDSKKSLKRWVQEIRYYENKAKPWEAKSKKIVRRYKDIRTPRESMPARYNILWANTQLMCQAVYGKRPKPDIDRRFRDNDDVGRVTSMLLERSIDFFVNEQFDGAMKQAVLDLQLPGRGTVWVRYEPHFKDAEVNENEEVADDGLQVTDDAEADPDSDETYEEVADEYVCYDYVHYEDFGHSFGRTWDEVEAGWRKVYMTKDELKERFPDAGEIPLDYSPQDIKDAKIEEVVKKATIYEIWCKSEKKVYWLHKDYQDGILDEQDDPLKIEGFWPFPKPLFSTLGNDDCIPVPDYTEYQDQAIELDELTSRIAMITKAVKVAGVYDSSAEGVQRLLAEGVENQLIPIDQMAVLGEKGGLAGVMMLMPMKEIMDTLAGLYEARDKVKQDLYEVTGLSDIMRGASDPNETYGAQRIKSQFGTLRLSARQDDVQRFCRDLVKIGTEIIANHFSMDTLKRISGIKLLSAQEKQMVQMSQQPPNPMMGHNGGPPMQGMPAPPPSAPMPLPPELAKLDPEELAEMMQDPTWEDVEELLKSEPMLAYKIDIETDSTIKLDQDADKASRMEFLQAMGSFLKEAMQASPEMAPFMAKALMFMMRGFNIGKELESSAELMIKKLEKKAQQPPPPNADMAKVQGDMQLQQQKQKDDKELKMLQLQIDQQKAQADSQSEIARLKAQAEVDTNQANLDAQLAREKSQQDSSRELAIAKMDNETKIIVAKIGAKAQLKSAAMGKEGSTSDGSDVSFDNEDASVDNTKDLLNTVIQQLQSTFSGLQQLGDSHKQLADAVTRPKRILRDENGNIVGVH